MASTRMSDVDLAARVARLTAGQRECLDLVDDHATSKEIARQLGISRHTVDARLRGAIQTLGVSSRREAAIIYRAAVQADGYQSFTYQSPRIVTALSPVDNAGHEQDADIADTLAEAGAGIDQRMQLAGAPARSAAGLPAARHAFGSQPSPAALPGQAGTVSDSAVWTAVGGPEFAVRRSSLRLWGGANDLSPAQRMVGILIVTILAMLAFGIFLSGIEALTLLQS